MMKVWHPDRFPANDAEMQALATRKIKEVLAAVAAIREDVTARRRALIEDVRRLLVEVGGDSEGLVMTSYESDDDGDHCYNYEILSLDGIRGGYFTDPDDIPAEEEELLEAIMKLPLEPWDTLDEEELTELRDYLKAEVGSES
jgi:hypothetical protein